MTSVTSRAQQYSQGKLRLKIWVFRRLQKTGSYCADVTWCGRLFQTREVATGKAQSPYVDSRVRCTTKDGDEAEHRVCPWSYTRSLLTRYLLIHLWEFTKCTSSVQLRTKMNWLLVDFDQKVKGRSKVSLPTEAYWSMIHHRRPPGLSSVTLLALVIELVLPS